MIFNFLLTVCIRVVNSAVCVGLYYGILTTFSIRPSFFFFFVQEPEKKVAAISGLLLGQLLRFLSIYNATLHQLLCIPHAITAFFLPYLALYYLFDNFHPSFTISTSSTFSIFLNSLIFQLSNPIILPSSLLARLGHIYLFRCKNKLAFLTGNFVGWSIGQICVLLVLQRLFTLLYKYRLRKAQNELVAKWNKSITKSMTKYLGEEFTAFVAQHGSEFLKYCNNYRKKYSNQIYQYLAKHMGRDFTALVRDYEWFMSEMQYFVLVDLMRNTGRVITIVLYITCVVYAARMPLPMFTHQIERTGTKTLSGKKKGQIERAYEFTGVPIDTTRTYEPPMGPLPKPWKGARTVWGMNMNLSGEEVKSQNTSGPSFETGLVKGLFEPNRWDRPLRYISNRFFSGALQQGASQYFFDTCQSDGKERIAFTYLPALSLFKELLKKNRIVSSTGETPSFDELDKNWLDKNKEKKENLNNELKTRIEALDTGFLFRDILEKRTRVCTDKTKKLCLPAECDPFLNGPRRVKINKLYPSENYAVPHPGRRRPPKSRINKKTGERVTVTPSIKKGYVHVEKGPEDRPESELIRLDERFIKLCNKVEHAWKNFSRVWRRKKKIARLLYGQYFKDPPRRIKNSKTFKSRGRKNSETSNLVEEKRLKLLYLVEEKRLKLLNLLNPKPSTQNPIPKTQNANPYQ